MAGSICKHFIIIDIINQLHGLWNPEVQDSIHRGSPIISILNRINLIPHIDRYFYTIRSNIDLPLLLGLPKSIFPVYLDVKILKALLSFSILAR